VARQIEELPTKANGEGASASNSVILSSDGLGRRKRKRKQNETASSNDGKWTPVFVNPEDEAYVRRALYSFSFSMPRRSREDGSTEAKQGKEHRIVYIITRSAFEKTTAELESMLKTES